jgi:hypothetical protein
MYVGTSRAMPPEGAVYVAGIITTYPPRSTCPRATPGQPTSTATEKSFMSSQPSVVWT